MTVHPLRQLLVITYVVVLVGLVARTHVLQDDRFGFCMFRDLNIVHIDYFWIDSEGGERRVSASRTLLGDAKQIAPTGKRGRDWILGYGALLLQIEPYADWMWETERPVNAVAFEARIRRRYYDRGPWIEDVIRAPATRR